MIISYLIIYILITFQIELLAVANALASNRSAYIVTCRNAGWQKSKVIYPSHKIDFCSLHPIIKLQCL